MKYTFYTNIKDRASVEMHIRWCRANLGQRGADWDFAGSQNPVIQIFNGRQAAFYRLKFPAHDFVR